jgi:ribosomal protein L37E
MKCRHRGLLTYDSALVFVPTTTGIPTNAGTTTVPGQHRCDRCGAVVPLGEAYDAPDEVQVEMRAAMLAAAWEPIGGVRDLATECERAGWSGWPYRQPQCANEHTGFLAAQIRNHERDLGEVNWAGQHMADHPIHDHDHITEYGND